MNVLSLFDGMSCGQIALNRAGIKVDNYYASELDKYAITVTQANYPETIQLGDVTKWREWDIDWSSIDLLIGGSPCQGFSFAGKQLAFDDPRSKLFFTFVDILERIKTFNPDVKFLLENVRMKKEYLDVISGQLNTDPVCINSALLSTQNRVRYYWCNWHVDQPVDKGILLSSVLDNAYTERTKSYCIDANYGKGSNLKRYLHRGSRQIVFTDTDFMNSVTTPRPKEEDCNKIGKDNRGKWRFLTPNECEILQTVPKDYTISAPNYWRYHMLGNGWTVDVIAHIFKGLL